MKFLDVQILYHLLHGKRIRAGGMIQTFLVPMILSSLLQKISSSGKKSVIHLKEPTNNVLVTVTRTTTPEEIGFKEIMEQQKVGVNPRDFL